MNDIAILVDNLTKTYQLYDSHFDRVKEAFHPYRKKYHRPFHAIRNLSISIRKGEFVGIIGRNGSGKSTLLQLITGILSPTSGGVKVNGKISALLELGAGFNPDFTGRQNVYLNGSILGISRDEIDQNFSAIEEFAEIGDFIDQPVKTYSSGMFVRLAFAIAINVNPEILIVDEALAVGDMFFQQKCIRHMEERMRGRTKLLVSHDIHAVINLCERVIVLDRGELIFSGSPLDGVEYYTKAIHDELYRKTVSSLVGLPGEGSVPDDSSVGTVDQFTLSAISEISVESNVEEGWVDISSEAIAGAREVVIRRVNLRTAKKAAVTTVIAGELLELRMIIETFSPVEQAVFGYMIKDRVGNGITGDNSLSIGERVFSLMPGQQMVTMTFYWPDIAPDEYLITLGIGQGDHPLHHIIQCWAHNVILVKSLTLGKVVHGIFTTPLHQCEVQNID
jgi:ABC-type polysaccharide/polyol phosphate transport system ATPase subunit